MKIKDIMNSNFYYRDSHLHLRVYTIFTYILYVLVELKSSLLDLTFLQI